jgi:hypothetical protein
MRTRIALVAIIPVALITVSTLTQAASVQSARAVTTRSSGTTTATAMTADQLTAFHTPAVGSPQAGGSDVSFDLAASLLSGRPIGILRTVPAAVPAPATVPAPAPAPPAGPVDTVTPAQRAAWERVAMCEEGGNWTSNGGRFSGGLGITRANWDAFGGLQYAPEGAEATADEQIMVAEHIQSYPPDQGGCSGW